MKTHIYRHTMPALGKMMRKKVNDIGTTSFALLGVLIILLSIIATAHISHLERLNYEESLRNDLLTKMDNRGEEYLDSIENKLHILGVQSAFDGKRERPAELFGNLSKEYLNNMMGDENRDGDLTVSLLYHNVTFGKRLAEVDDILPVDTEDLREDHPGEEIKSNRSFNYEIKGTLEVLVKEVSSGTELTKGRELVTAVDIPYPFIKEKSSSFQTAAAGAQGHVGRMVEYMLTTVAQYRTLTGDGNTSNILNEEDVELAVNLALILEIAYQFRYYDRNATRALSENVTCGRVDLLEILDTYSKSGRVDPGDIIAIYHGYTYDDLIVTEDEVIPLNISTIISQALYALVDQFVFNYLDNFGMLDILDITMRGIRRISDVVGDISEGVADFFVSFYPWDEDDEDINPEHVELVKNWVEETFVSAGLMSTHLSRAIYHPFDSINGERIVGYPRLPDDFDVNFSLDATARLTGDEHRWYRYDCEHGEPHRGMQGDFCNETVIIDDPDLGEIEVQCGAEEVLVGYDYVKYSIGVNVGPGQIFFNEVDLLNSDDKIWQDFFNEHYEGHGDDEVNSVRDAVAKFIEMMVDTILEHPELREKIEELSKVGVDVGDRRSFFHDIRDAVNQAVDTAFEHYRENPGDVADIVREFLHDDGPQGDMEALKELLESHYHEFTGESFVDDAVYRTADMLLSPESPYLEFEVINKEISMEDVDWGADMSWNTERSFPRKKVSRLVEDTPDYQEFIGKLSDHTHDAYAELKVREVGQECQGYCTGNGLLIQALDHYQYYDGIDTNVRSGRVRGSGPEGIESIYPNPATRGVDIVHFNSSLDEEDVRLTWISDLDGSLSEEPYFNISADFLSPGSHNITLIWSNYEGDFWEDFEELRINIPPTAIIDEVGPWWEKSPLTFTHSSYDPEGQLDYVHWDFGDGNTSTDDEGEHAYENPGLYNVTLTVYDYVGANDTDMLELLIDDRPRVVSLSPDVTDPLFTDVEFEVTFSEKVEPESLEYSIEPSIAMEEEWLHNDTIVLLRAENNFQRDTSYNLTIEYVHDVDNGTSSPLLEEYNVEFDTVDFAALLGWHPSGDEVPVNREVVLNFSEGVELVGEVEDLISGDFGWTAEFSGNQHVLTLFHDPFPSGSFVELELNLEVLVASLDHSAVVSEEGTIISFETQDTSHPLLTSTTPPADATDVNVDEPIVLNFDTPLNVSSFNYQITPEPHGLFLQWSEDNKTVEIHHDGLMGDTLYLVKFSGVDMKGMPFTALHDDPLVSEPFMFRTKEVINPAVLHFSPGNDLERFLSGAPITLVFNKPMNTSSLNFEMTPSAGEHNIEWNDMGTAAYVHFLNYSAGEWYNFTLVDGEDPNGNLLPHELTISFRISYNDDQIEGSLFERKLWSLIGGGMDRFGGSLLDLSEEFLKGIVSNMVLSSDFSKLEYRVPLNTDEPFTYDEYGELDLQAVLEPSFISLRDTAVVELLGGTHYTDVTSISSRPYETHWEVSVPNVTAALNVSSVGEHLLIRGKSREVWINESIDIGFSVRITVASGWALEGVDYEIFDDIFTTVRNFLNKIWDYLKSAVSYVIDGIQRILELFDSIVERLKEYAQEIIQVLAGLVERIVEELLEPAAQQMLNHLRDRLEKLDAVLSILGLDMLIDIDPEGKPTSIPMYDEEVLRFLNVSIGGELFGTSYTMNVNMLTDTVVAFGRLSVRDMRFQWTVEPFLDSGVYDGWFQCMGTSVGGSTELEMAIPSELEESESTSLSLGNYTGIGNVRIPIGPVVVSDIDLGLELVYEGGNFTEMLEGLLYTAFRDTVEALRKTALGFNYLVEFVRTLVRNILEGFISIGREFIKELVLFFEATINEIELKLLFGIRGGESVANFVLWVAESIGEMIEGIVKMRPTLPGSGPPMSVIKDTYLGVEIGRELFTGYFYANVPAISAGLGRDMGPWNVNFGLKCPELAIVRGELRGG